MTASSLRRRPREPKTKPRKRAAPAPRTKPLRWPRRPRIGQHPHLGRVRSWRSRCRLYCVAQYTEATGDYLATVQIEVSWGHAWALLSRHRTLNAARKACEQHARRVARGGQP